MSTVGPISKTLGLHDKTEKFEIGYTKVALSGDDLIIGEDTYVGTPGLWELITSKSLDSGIYTSGDIDNYTTILLHTQLLMQKPGRLAINIVTMLNLYTTSI
jgi:hypothetical protein